MAMEELNRVSHLARQSLGFYRESTSPSAVNVEEMVESIMEIYAKRTEAKKVTVTKQYKSNGAAIVSYSGEILLMDIGTEEAKSSRGRWGINPDASETHEKRSRGGGSRSARCHCRRRRSFAIRFDGERVDS
jgi:hypothetical protein